jgi:SpoIID/LytB domain protein
LSQRRGLLWGAVAALSLAALGAGLVPIVSCGAIDRAISGDSTPVAPTSTYKSEPDVRIRVERAARTLRVQGASGPGKVLVRPVGGVATSQILPGPLAISSSPSGITIVDGTGKSTKLGPGVDSEFLAAPEPGRPPETGAIKVNDTTFPGVVAVRPRWSDPQIDSGAFDVIVEIPMETYLPGVVVKEMWPGWPRGAYEVQAVCARTYAAHERERSRRAGKSFDLENSTLDQVYGGISASASAIEAVKNTRGMMIYDGSELLRAYYSSTCGGRPGSAADVWPTTAGFEYNLAGPIQGRARKHYCQGSTRYRWEVTRSVDDLSARLRVWGQNNGNPVKLIANVASVRVQKVNSAERPTRYLVTADDGKQFQLTAEEFRVGCNTSVPGLAPINKDTQVFSGDVEVEVFGGSAHIRGRGFGHGVGMCQWCAKGMADAGISWRTQIEIFYPDATLKKAW